MEKFNRIRIDKVGIALVIAMSFIMPVKAQNLSELRKKVQVYPDSLKLHQLYIKEYFSSISVDQREHIDSLIGVLAKQYDSWMVKFPTSYVVPYAIGENLAQMELPVADNYLKLALERNMHLSKAWMYRSIFADLRGDKKLGREYMHQATLSDPGDEFIAFQYAMSLRHVDKASWHQAVDEFSKQFPDGNYASGALALTAYYESDTTEKIRIYEQVIRKYTPSKAENACEELFELYIMRDPARALALAKEMGRSGKWPARDSLASAIIAVNDCIKNSKYKEGYSILEKIRLPRYSNLHGLMNRLKAQTLDGAGETAAAFNLLLPLVAKTPTDEFINCLNNYGSKLGKSGAVINQEIWKEREKTIQLAPKFELGMYTSGNVATLDTFKGKVTLVTFWFPGCGPCRAEFPNFQHVIDKFSRDKVAYVGINVEPTQDEFVLPYLQGTGYSFMPLRADAEWARKNFNVNGTPANFLIDQHGMIVFSDFRVDEDSERTLELMIKSLLERG